MNLATIDEVDAVLGWGPKAKDRIPTARESMSGPHEWLFLTPEWDLNPSAESRYASDSMQLGKRILECLKFGLSVRVLGMTDWGLMADGRLKTVCYVEVI